MMEPFRVRHRFAIQALSFLTILLSSILLYLAAEQDAAQVSQVLLGILTLAMLVGMWVS